MEPFDYEEFGAQLAFERDYPEHSNKEKVRDKAEIISDIKRLLEELESMG